MAEEIFREDSYARSCGATVVAAGPDGIRLDRTVFYPMGGGQPGDTGLLRLPGGGTVLIADTRKDADTGDILHIPGEWQDLPAPGVAVEAEIDWDRRYRLMRMHTCMHLLSSQVAGGVTGGSVGDGKGRLDFDLPDKVLDKDELTEVLNRLIAEDHPVKVGWITDEELAAQPELVRTMSVKPPMGAGRVRIIEVEGVDLQPCGGTHVRSTAEIGRILVRKIENKGRHNRRINIVFADEG